MRKSAAASSLSAEAYNSVRERILRGELPMGEVISRRKIAAELGMSFVPVSEALQRLELEGLLESRPRAGTRVRIPTQEDVRGHYVVREALETQAARLFAELATKSEREEIMKLAVKVDELYKRRDRQRYLELHERLHRRIAECARCPALSQAIEHTHSLASTWFCVEAPQLGQLNRPHYRLAKGLCSRDPDEAARAMRTHVQTSLQRTMMRLDAHFREAGRSTFPRRGKLEPSRGRGSSRCTNRFD